MCAAYPGPHMRDSTHVRVCAACTVESSSPAEPKGSGSVPESVAHRLNPPSQAASPRHVPPVLSQQLATDESRAHPDKARATSAGPACGAAPSLWRRHAVAAPSTPFVQYIRKTIPAVLGGGLGQRPLAAAYVELGIRVGAGGDKGLSNAQAAVIGGDGEREPAVLPQCRFKPLVRVSYSAFRHLSAATASGSPPCARFTRRAGVSRPARTGCFLCA